MTTTATVEAATITWLLSPCCLRAKRYAAIVTVAVPWFLHRRIRRRLMTAAPASCSRRARRSAFGADEDVLLNFLFVLGHGNDRNGDCAKAPEAVPDMSALGELTQHRECERPIITDQHLQARQGELSLGQRYALP